MKTKAAVFFEKSGKFSIENLDIDDPREDRE
jgi:Zn-dependent alcohol dehydrogenase